MLLAGFELQPLDLKAHCATADVVHLLSKKTNQIYKCYKSIVSGKSGIKNPFCLIALKYLLYDSSSQRPVVSVELSSILIFLSSSKLKVLDWLSLLSIVKYKIKFPPNLKLKLWKIQFYLILIAKNTNFKKVKKNSNKPFC